MTHARVGHKAGGISLDVELALGSGITALAGPSGAGKTLLLEILAGVTTPANGRILIDNAIVFDADSRVNLTARRRRAGYVPAHDALFPQMTVRQNLMFAADRWARLERHKRVAEMLERFELADTLDQRPHLLPPDRRLRVEIARALMSEPRLLLIDERGADEALLRLLSGAFDGPILLVTGDLGICYAAASHLALLDSGRILQRGPARETIEHPESVEAARLLGIDNLFPATIAALDPGRNQSRLECGSFALAAPYLKGHLKGDRVWVGIRAEDVAVHSGEIEVGVNYISAALRHTSLRLGSVRLEFTGGIAAQIPRRQFEQQKDNRSWQVEFPPTALRVF